MKTVKVILIFYLVVSAFLLDSCRKTEPAGDKKNKIFVVTSLFPIYDFTKQVGQNKVDVSLLLSPGVEAHSFDPRPADIIRVSNADILVYTDKFMEPWIDNLLQGINNKSLLVVNSSDGINLNNESDENESEHNGHSHGSVDPHIWLDFSNARKMVDNIRDALIKKDPDNKDFYRKNAAEYNSKLAALDDEFKTTLARCKLHTAIYSGHFAFGYLAKKYNLTFFSAYKGFTPDAEPTPKNIVELIEKIKQLNAKYIFYEELISPKVAKTLAQETGTELLPLYAAHNITKDAFDNGVSFISLMRINLENLKLGLQCQ